MEVAETFAIAILIETLHEFRCAIVEAARTTRLRLIE